MITELDTNLLEYPLESFGHFCNCQLVMGGGLALRVKDKYPELYKADLQTKKGDSKKLGSFSHAMTHDGKLGVNLYTQFNYGHGARYTSYDAVCNSLVKVNQFVQDNGLKTLGLPKNAGCVLGGGKWRIVKSIIDDIFEKSPVELYICNYDK
jgi:O-acetyl-ADP-ribose deacetylase (regulator of RNase III)